MMKKFLKSPWTISIATALFAFFLILIYDLVKGKHILSTIGSILVVIKNAIITFLTFDLKVWWVIVALLILFVILYFVYKYYDYKDSVTLKPDFLKYTKDTIQGWSWEWIWQKDNGGNYYVEDLHPICPICNTPLVISDNYDGSSKCLRCERNFKKELPYLDHIEMLIKDNVRRNSFAKSEDDK